MKNLENLRSVIASISMNEIRTAVLEDEIVLAKSRLEPRDTGHLHDYIARLSNRLEEINPYDEDKDPYAG